MTDLHLDAQLLEQLEQMAAGSRMDVNQFLAEAVRSYLRQVEAEAMKVNIDAYLDGQAELLKSYPSQYVAFHQGRLVDHDQDFQAIHSRIRRQFGRLPVLIRQVNPAAERAWNFRSPRFVRQNP